MLDEGAEQPPVRGPDGEIALEKHVTLGHGGAPIEAGRDVVGGRHGAQATLSPCRGRCRSPRPRRAEDAFADGLGREDGCLEQDQVGALAVVEHGAGGAALDDPTLLHDDDAVADVVGGGEVVGDVDVRHPQIVAQGLEQVDDRAPQRRVDHRDRLVGDDQRRPRDQRPGNRRPLKLAAGQLVREAPLHLCERQAHLLQGGVGAGPDGGGRPGVCEAARGHEQVAVNTLQGIEGLKRVLKDGLHVAHEVHPRAGAADGGQIGTAEADGAGCWRDEIEDHPRQGGLARAGLADDGEDLGPRRLEGEADVVDRVERAPPEQAAKSIALGDVVDGEEIGAHCRVSSGGTSAGTRAGASLSLAVGRTSGLAAKQATDGRARAW
jgi:hypothetical protein